MNNDFYFTTGIAASAIVSALAAVYLYNDNKLFPEASSEYFNEPSKEEPATIECMEAEQDYDIDGSFEVCWDNEVDVSGWKFSQGGYFITEDTVILPSTKNVIIKGECEWVKSKVPVKLRVSKKVIKKSVK